MNQDYPFKKSIQDKLSQIQFDKIDNAEKIWDNIESQIRKKDKKRVFVIWITVLFMFSTSIISISYTIFKPKSVIKPMFEGQKESKQTEEYASSIQSNSFTQERSVQSDKKLKYDYNQSINQKSKPNFSLINQEHTIDFHIESGLAKSKSPNEENVEKLKDNSRIHTNEEKGTFMSSNSTIKIDNKREILDIPEIKQHFTKLKYIQNIEITPLAEMSSPVKRFELWANLGIGYTTLLQNPNSYDHLFISNYKSDNRNVLERLLIQTDFQMNYKIGNNYYLSSKIGLQYAQWKFSYDKNTISYQQTQISSNETLFKRSVSSQNTKINEEYLNFHLGLGLGRRFGNFDIVSTIGLEKNIINFEHSMGRYLESKFSYRFAKNHMIGTFLHGKLDRTPYSNFVLETNPVQYGLVWQYKLH